jgi:hypothetical protein
MGHSQGKIDREYRLRHPAIARNKSAIEPFGSGTQLAHKTVSENEFLGCFEHLPLTRQDR